MTVSTDGADSRPGCLTGRLLGAAARLTLVYPLLSIGSQLGQAAENALLPQVGTPYEGALLGAVAGLAIGLSLWLRSLGPAGWRSQLADATLALVSAVWLAALIAGMTGRFTADDLIVPWLACLTGSAGIAALVRL